MVRGDSVLSYPAPWNGPGLSRQINPIKGLHMSISHPWFFMLSTCTSSSCSCFLSFLATSCCLQDLIFPTRVWTQGPQQTVIAQNPNHWTASEFFMFFLILPYSVSPQSSGLAPDSVFAFNLALSLPKLSLLTQTFVFCFPCSYSSSVTLEVMLPPQGAPWELEGPFAVPEARESQSE